MESWGYKAQLDMRKPSAKDYCLLTNLKVHLDQKYDVRPLPDEISVRRAISDYFRKLNEYIVPIIQKDLPASERQRNDHLQYCLAVPGHWSDQAKQAIRSAAMEAGLAQRTDPHSRLISISEEEAMAIYCVRKNDEVDIKHGDRFMICYAPEGEGVTLVMFEVSGSASYGRVQQLKEVARSFGPSCGSDFVEANVERLLERQLRKYRDIISAAQWENLMFSFTDMIGGQFDGQEDQFLLLPTLLKELIDQRGNDMAAEEARIDDGYIILTAADLKDKVFEPVVKDVLDVIRTFLAQVGENCKTVFLTGQFGSSEYVWRRVREEFKEQVGVISCPPRPELAISRGAVYAGLDSYRRQ